MSDEHPNCQAVETFLNQIAPNVRIAHTERINDEHVKHGYTAAFFDAATAQGFTVVAWGDEGYFKVVVEMVGNISKAQHIGEEAAKIFGKPE